MDNSPNLPKIYTAKEAAELLRVELTTLLKYARENKIESIQLNGKNRLFSQEHIQRFLQDNSHKVN